MTNKKGDLLIMWKEYIQSATSGYHFTKPAIKSDISLIKEKLHVELPSDLLELFNGVFDESNLVD